MTIEIIIEKREKYDNNENNDIDDDIEDEYREGLKAKRE